MEFYIAPPPVLVLTFYSINEKRHGCHTHLRSTDWIKNPLLWSQQKRCMSIISPSSLSLMNMNERLCTKRPIVSSAGPRSSESQIHTHKRDSNWRKRGGTSEERFSGLRLDVIRGPGLYNNDDDALRFYDRESVRLCCNGLMSGVRSSLTHDLVISSK